MGVGSVERDSLLEMKEKRLDLRFGRVVLVHVSNHPHAYLIGGCWLECLNTFLLRYLRKTMSGVLVKMARVLLADKEESK